MKEPEMKNGNRQFRTGLAAIAFVLTVASAAFAQRYVYVSPGAGTLNDALTSDSLNRIANPNTTWYVLQRGSGSDYYLSKIIRSWGSVPLQIMSSGSGPLPRIIGGLQTGGVDVNKLFVATQNLTVRGVFLTGLSASGLVDQRITELSADGITVWFDSCQVNLAWQSAVRVNNGLSKVVLTNSTISNMNNYYPSNGRVVDNRDISMDTLIIQNCSIFRGVTQVYRGSTGSLKYAFIDHNTFDEYSGPLFNFNQAGTIVFQNNLVVDCGFVGRDTSSTGNQLLTVAYGADSALIRNNCFYSDTALLRGAWPDSVSFDPWFDDSLSTFIERNGTGATNISAPVKFNMAPDDITVDQYLVKIDSIARWYWANPNPTETVNPIEQVDSIQLVDFKYNTDSPAYTLGVSGEPVGALTWFGMRLSVKDKPRTNPPKNFTLIQNYPNPFNPSTTIEYVLPQAVRVRLVIFNILGQNVKTLVDGYQYAGSHAVVWNGTDRFQQPAASGVYFYKLDAGNMSTTRKMILLK